MCVPHIQLTLTILTASQPQNDGFLDSLLSEWEISHRTWGIIIRAQVNTLELGLRPEQLDWLLPVGFF